MAKSSAQQVVRERQTIRTRLLLLLMGLTTAAVLAVGYLGIRSVQSIGSSARQTSAGALRAQAEEYLRRATTGDVQKNDLELAAVASDAMKVAQFAGEVFENPDTFAGSAYWRAEDHMFVAPDGQYMNGEEDTSSAFVPSYVAVDEEIDRLLELGAYLDLVFAPTHESNPNTVAIYMGTEQDTTQYYPNISLGSLVPPDFRVTERPWYVSAAPGNNPEREVVWSPVYADATGQGLMVTAAAPVYAQDEFVGAVGIDVTLLDLTASVEKARLLGSGYGFLIDDAGVAIAMPEQGYRDILGREPEPDEVGADVGGSDTQFAPILADMMAGAEGFDTLRLGDKELFVAYAPLETTGWSLANVVETSSVLQALASLETDLERSTRTLVRTRVLPLGLAILAIVGIAGVVTSRRITNPIQEMVVAARQIGAGEWEVPLPRQRNDEIGVLADAFGQMTERLRQVYAELEDRVTAQTRDLRERAIQLETSAQVAREAAAIQEVDQLLDNTVDLISDRFGFYHAGIFLLDERGEYAVLRAASSEGGQRMLSRQHSLKVGEVGIVGYVAGAAKPRIALDVGEDAVFFDNPDLPNTRSEMALPLVARGRLIGVLDVQSVEAEAFDDADVAVLQTMADQVALAIENARLLREAEERVEEIQALLGRQSREGWGRMAEAQPGWGYAYDGARVFARTEDTSLPFVVDDEGTGVKTPLRVRGTTIGEVRLRLGDRSPTPDEEALIQEVVEQASQALESARLFQETQRALSEADILYRASEAIGSADSPSGLLKAITGNVLAPQIDRCILGLVDPASALDAPAVVVEAAWERGTDEPSGLGERWSAQDHRGAHRIPILADLLSPPSPETGPKSPCVFSDVSTSSALDDVSRRVLGESMGVKSAVAIPLVAGQRTLGLLLIESLDQPYAFSGREVRRYETLADQAAVALEGMRLLQETGRRAERERLTAQISSRVWGSADVDSILRTTVGELGKSLQASDALIELDLGDGGNPPRGQEQVDAGRRMQSTEPGNEGARGRPEPGERSS
ncbi:MAG: GAF domain-containing protein [Anaerolineae bacterium]